MLFIVEISDEDLNNYHYKIKIFNNLKLILTKLVGQFNEPMFFSLVIFSRSYSNVIFNKFWFFVSSLCYTLKICRLHRAISKGCMNIFTLLSSMYNSRIRRICVSFLTRPTSYSQSFVIDL
jgi:hypothetical protein